jgi:hypothetical protein
VISVGHWLSVSTRDGANIPDVPIPSALRGGGLPYPCGELADMNTAMRNRESSPHQSETTTAEAPIPLFAAALAVALDVPATALDTYPVNSRTIVIVRTVMTEAAATAS